MEAMDCAEWSETSYRLDEILKEFTPPLTVLVDEGYMLDENQSLAAGQVITIQSQESLTQFKGYDEENKRVCIPVSCPFKVRVVSQFEGRPFNSIRQISDAQPPVQFVKLLSKGHRELANVNKGDRLKILLSERDKQGPTCLHLRNQNGKHLRLPIDFNGKFCESGESDEEHFLKDLAYRQPPFFIKFVVNNQKSTISDLVGIIKLTELKNETVTFCTAYSNGKRFIAAFPVSFDVKVRPRISSNFNHKKVDILQPGGMRIQRLRESILIENAADDGIYTRFLPLDSSDNKEEFALTPTQVNDKREKEGLIGENSGEVPANKDDELHIKRNDPKRKSTGLLSKVKLKLRGTKSNEIKSKRKRPEIVVVRDSSGACSDGGDSGIYEEIPTNTYVSMDIINGIQRTIGRSKSTPVKKSSISDGDIPPPLPANHPIERRHTVCSKNSSRPRLGTNAEQEIQGEQENFRKFYECMRRSEEELKELTIEDVGEILKQLKLSKYIEKFRESKIDGKLLVDLDEAVFKDMELSPFDSRKLRKYVFGWRPDKQDKFISKHSGEYKDNQNAMLWNENEVEAHINSLGMTEFAIFCKENQVNGNLLWDIVVDDEMVIGLLNGKDRKLNAIKLKNYVTEGWRPKVRKRQSSGDGNLSKVRSKSFNAGKLQTGLEKKKVARRNSKYDSINGVTSVKSASPPFARDSSKDIKSSNMASKQISPTSITVNTSSNESANGISRRTNQPSASLYHKPVMASSKARVSPPKTTETVNRNEKKKQTSNTYEEPIIRPASYRRTPTVSRQTGVGSPNAYEEPVKWPPSSNNVAIGKQTGTGGASHGFEKGERTATIATKPSFSCKQAASRLTSLSQQADDSRSDVTRSKGEMARKNTGRNNKAESQSSRGTSPNILDSSIEKRPMSRLQAKVNYPQNSPYARQGGSASQGGNAVRSGSASQGGNAGRDGSASQGGNASKGGNAGRSGSASQGGNAGRSGSASQGGNAGRDGSASQGGNAGRGGNASQHGNAGRGGNASKGGNAGRSGSASKGGNAGRDGSASQGGNAGRGGNASQGGKSSLSGKLNHFKEEIRLKPGGEKGEQKQNFSKTRKLASENCSKLSRSKESDLKTDKGTSNKNGGNTEKAANVSCKNAKQKSEQFGTDISGLSKLRDLKTGEKRSIVTVDKARDTFQGKFESKAKDRPSSGKVTDDATDAATVRKIKSLEKQRPTQSPRDGKKSLLHHIRGKCEQKHLQGIGLKKELKNNGVISSKECKHSTDNARHEEEIHESRKSVAQLKKQFDRS